MTLEGRIVQPGDASCTRFPPLHPRASDRTSAHVQFNVSWCEERLQWIIKKKKMYVDVSLTKSSNVIETRLS